jgi:hypothetical protein
MREGLGRILPCYRSLHDLLLLGELLSLFQILLWRALNEILFPYFI